MPSPIYQYVINLVVSLTIRGGPGVFVNVPVREHRALNHTLFYNPAISKITQSFALGKTDKA